MNFIETQLKDLFIIEPEPFRDDRGIFYRVFCKDELETIGHNKEIVQINHSLTTRKGTIRGMHFQYPPKAEIKMIKCISGRVFDVAIDLRKVSPTFLQWHGEILSAESMKMIYIPEGFAHGFQALEENCEMLYFHTEFYNKEYERGVRYNDPSIGIEWETSVTNISDRDRNHPLIDSAFKGIEL